MINILLHILENTYNIDTAIHNIIMYRVMQRTRVKPLGARRRNPRASTYVRTYCTVLYYIQVYIILYMFFT